MPVKTVVIPDYGEFTIRTFPARMRPEIYELLGPNVSEKGLSLRQSYDMQCRAILHGTVNGGGTMYQSLAEVEDLDAPLFDALSTEILRHNGIGVRAVDDAAKNSEPSPSGSSPSD